MLLYVALAAVFFYVLKRFRSRGMGAMASVAAFAQSKGRLLDQEKVQTTFKDVAGVDEAIEELREVVTFLNAPERYRRIGAKVPKGVLLVGPPGTGKTLLARAVAGEAKVPFISINGSEFVEMLAGVGAARARDLFRQAARQAPCIVFIDELDAIGRSRAGPTGFGGSDERDQTLNQLLVEMDGFDSTHEVIVMAATNRPEVLDPALLRAGRFDRHVLVDRPDRIGREAILRIHAREVELGDDVDLAAVAARTPGFAGADLASLINEAALLSVRRDIEAVDMQAMSSAIDRVVAGLQKSNRLVSPADRKRVAYHEVGHALASVLGDSDQRVHKISIIPRGLGALGFTLQHPDEETQLLTKPAIHARLMGLLGGRAAEELVFGEPSTGAQNDLSRATEIARAMVVDYGMSEAVGPVALKVSGGPNFLGAESERSKIGAELANKIDVEVRRIVEDALTGARELLSAQRAMLDRITAELLERDELEGELLKRLLDEARGEPSSASADAGDAEPEPEPEPRDL
jgi:cell division protease FtsH